MPAIFDEQKKISQKNSRRFLNSLDNEKSGFYQQTNSKGEPLCDGFDNYCALLESTTKKSTPLSKMETQKTQDSNIFRNPFDRDTPLPILGKKHDREKINEDAKYITFDFKKRIETPGHNSLKKQSPSATLFKDTLRRRKLEEENKICNDTFKAQNIRSLTLETVHLY